MKNFLTILILAIFLVTNNVTAYPEDTWWDTDWKYAKIINISENSGHDLYDYQILLKINYNESMQPDFDDLRFTYYNSSSDKETKIPYWIEEKIDGNYSKVWIKIPFISANGNIVIKMYYGNDNSESESNGLDVFLDFDDFEYADTPENHGWGIMHNNSNTVIQTSTNYAKTGNRSLKIFDPYGPWTSNSFAVIGRNYVKSGAAEIWFRDIQGQNIRDSQVFMYKDNIYENEVIVGVSEINSPGKYGYRFAPEEVLHPSIFSRTNDWHKFTIAWNDTDYRVYIDEKYVASRSGGQPSKLQIGGYWDTDTSIYYWDSMKIRKFIDPEPTYTIINATPPSPPEPPEPPLPAPTDRSIILTNDDFRNILSATPTKLPLLVAGSLTPEVEKFINEYRPDYIYTLGFSLGLNNSYEIAYDQVPELFFPDATQAVYAEDRTKAILGSNIAYYLGIPLIFEENQDYEPIDLESKTIDEIQDFYVQKLKENGDNTNYLVLANFNSEESETAGYLAGLRRGFIIPVFNSSAEHALGRIKDSIAYLGSRKLFSESLDYKKGGPLYLAIIGNESSVNFWEIPDLFSEVFDDKDGNSIYSDIMYGDVNRDGRFELATGRLDGLASETTLNLARQRLPAGNKAVLIGEYRHGKFADMLFAFGGMSQAFILDKMILNNVETERIVEKRIDAPRISGDMDELLKDVAKIAASETLSRILGWFWNLPSYTDMGITVMYSIFEFDWDPWLSHPGGFPDHLPVIDGNLNGHFQNADVVGYFGLGDRYWLMPKENRSWTELYFRPYSGSSNFTGIRFSGFLYDDHDISAESEIKRQVQAQGGEVLGSSGVIHDPYTTMTSASFFSGLDSGKSLGEAFNDVMNVNPADRAISAVLYPSHPLTKSNAYLCVKDLIERILFADPAYKPVGIQAKAAATGQSFSVTPSGSFSIAAEVESNYTVQNRSLTVFNADSYLMEQERPIVPVFVREFILPTNSIVEKVNVGLKYSQKRGLEKNIIYNDSFYTNYTALLITCMEELGLGMVANEPDKEDEVKILGCMKEKSEPVINYPYPNESYWYKTQRLLDDRTSVYVYVPAIIYGNKDNAKILEDAKVTVEYDSQAELNVETYDTGIGKEETIRIKLFNQNDEISGDLFVWIDGNESWNFTESVILPANSSAYKEFSVTPSYRGIYSIKALFISENITIGPRNSQFEVGGLDFDLNKKFVPSEVRLQKKKYSPAVNFPEIRVRNTGILNITSLKLTDETPEGFCLPGQNSFRKIDVDDESFDTDEKIPVFVFLMSERNDNFFKKDKKEIKMLKRKFYNVTVSGDKISIEIGNFSRTNFGRDVGNNDVLLVKYLISSEKADRINSPGNMTTDTVANAFSDGLSSEKSAETKLLVR